jgi:hypothetical protein
VRNDKGRREGQRKKVKEQADAYRDNVTAGAIFLPYRAAAPQPQNHGRFVAVEFTRTRAGCV